MAFDLSSFAQQHCLCNTPKNYLGKSLGKSAHLPFQRDHPSNEAYTRRCQKSVSVNAVKEPEIESVEEIENDMENQSTASLYARFDELLDNTMQDYNLGDSVRGTIATVDEKGAFVDVGGKSPAWIPIQEVSNLKIDNVTRVLEPNTERDFHVVYRNRNPKPGRHEIVVSLKQIEKSLIYKRLQQMSAEKVTVEGVVTGNNSGGLFVLTEGVTAFCPGSLIPQEMKSEEGLEGLKGKKLKFHILEVNPDSDRLLLSARGQQMMSNNAQQVYKVGDVVLGKVTSVQSYGAFLSIGEGVDGLLHVSQISNDRVDTVSTVLSPGDELKVMVLTHDMEKGRLSLSTRKLEPTPGDMLKNPQLVFEKAEEMAEEFKRRVAEVEAEYQQAADAEQAESEAQS